MEREIGCLVLNTSIILIVYLFAAIPQPLPMRSTGMPSLSIADFHGSSPMGSPSNHEGSSAGAAGDEFEDQLPVMKDLPLPAGDESMAVKPWKGAIREPRIGWNPPGQVIYPQLIYN